jgi:hypothetical protein
MRVQLRNLEAAVKQLQAQVARLSAGPLREAA